jgi:hypothetical protein
MSPTVEYRESVLDNNGGGTHTNPESVSAHNEPNQHYDDFPEVVPVDTSPQAVPIHQSDHARRFTEERDAKYLSEYIEYDATAQFPQSTTLAAEPTRHELPSIKDEHQLSAEEPGLGEETNNLVFGMKRKTFIIVFLVLFVVIAAGIGGGVGGSMASSQNDSTATNTISESPSK